MISLLITVLMVCLIFGVVWYLVRLLPLPEPFGMVAQVVILLIFVLVLIGFLMPLTGANPVWWPRY